MKAEIQKFTYGGTSVEFDIDHRNIMINATEMAKIFNKRIDVFLKAEGTKAFIEALKFPPFGGNSESLKYEEIIQTKGKSGTWMHRKLALKFAGWLDPAFEVWVYGVIERLLFGETEEVRSSHELMKVIIDRMREIDQTASLIMKERYQLQKQKEALEEKNLRLLGLN